MNIQIHACIETDLDDILVKANQLFDYYLVFIQ